jgi:hypothetical protein
VAAILEFADLVNGEVPVVQSLSERKLFVGHGRPSPFKVAAEARQTMMEYSDRRLAKDDAAAV